MNYPSQHPSIAWDMLKNSQKKKKILLPSLSKPKPLNSIRFVAIADTHNGHSKLDVPDGDILLVCGDITFYDKTNQMKSFDRFLGTLPHSKKIIIGGNHDLGLFEDKKRSFMFTNGDYLEDSSISVFGYKIYGTPWAPIHSHGAFMLERGEPLIEKWKLIPDDTDILMTHTPPVGYGDKTTSNNNVGDVDLLLAVQNRIKPLVHVFGHIHEGKGSWTDGRTIFINASVCNQHYRPVNSAAIFDLPSIN